MKKLMWMVVFALACVACSKDDDDLSVGELVGKWSIYEFEEDQECLTMAEGLIALENATLYFGEKLELQQDK